MLAISFLPVYYPKQISLSVGRRFIGSNVDRLLNAGGSRSSQKRFFISSNNKLTKNSNNTEIKTLFVALFYGSMIFYACFKTIYCVPIVCHMLQSAFYIRCHKIIIKVINLSTDDITLLRSTDKRPFFKIKIFSNTPGVSLFLNKQGT